MIRVYCVHVRFQTKQGKFRTGFFIAEGSRERSFRVILFALKRAYAALKPANFTFDI